MKEPDHAMGCDVVGTPGAADRVRAEVAFVKRSVAAATEQLRVLYPRHGGVNSSSSVAVTLGMDPPVPEASIVLTSLHSIAGGGPSRGTSSGTPTGVVPQANLLADGVVYFRAHNVRL